MSKTKRKWIDLDFASPDALRAQDLPYDADESTKDRIDYNDLILKQAEATGVISGGALTVNGIDDGTFDIAAIDVMFVDQTNMTAPLYKKFSITAQTGLDPDLTGVRSKWVGIQLVNDVPTFVYQTSFSALELRSTVIVGRVFGPGTGPITTASNQTYRSWGDHKTTEDLILALGSINISGNVYTANGANLLLNKSAGEAFRYAVNYADEPTSPNIVEDPVQTGITAYQYHLSGVASTTMRSAIDPGFYDVNGVRTPVPSNKWTVQAVYYFPKTGNSHVVYGQHVYNSKDEAKTKFVIDGYELNEDILRGSILRAYIFVNQAATALNNTAQAEIVDAALVWGSIVQSGTLTETNVATLTNKTITDPSNIVHATQVHFKVKAGAAGIIKGTPLRRSGFDEVLNVIEVIPSNNILGVTIAVAEDAIANGEVGEALSLGTLDFMDTSSWSSGAILYPNNTGGWTDTKPAIGWQQRVAYVQYSDATNGILQINVHGPLQSAGDVSYDNTISGLTSVTVQDALDEVSNPGAIIGAQTKEETGFDNTVYAKTRDLVDLSGTTTTLFSIKPNAANVTEYSYFYRGTRVTISAEKTIALTPASNRVYWIYFSDANGTLNAVTSISGWEEIIRDNVFVAELIYNNAGTAFVSNGFEAHATMDWFTHYYLHSTRRTAWASGGDVAINTSTPTNQLMSVASATIEDEDIIWDTATINNTDTIRTLYRAQSGWDFSDYLAGVYNIGGVPYYNSGVSPNWTQLPVGNNRYVLVHVYARPDWVKDIFTIMGQAEYATLTAARDAASFEINRLASSGLVFPEFKALATAIVHNNSGTWRFVNVDANGNTIIDWRNTQVGSPVAGSGAIANHSLLTNLNVDDHLQYLRTDGTRALTGNQSAGTFKITNLGNATEDADALNRITGDGRYEPKNANIQSHISSTSNPHSVTKTQVGLGNVQNVDTTNASNITSGTLPSSVLPPVALTEVHVVASEAAQLALVAQEGDVAVRTDLSRTYMHNGGTAGTMADWTELQTPTDTVLSVNGQTGTVVLTTNNVADSSNKRYVTDAQLVVIGNTSGTNTGDETTLSIQTKRPLKTVDGKSLEGTGAVQVLTSPSTSPYNWNSVITSGVYKGDGNTTNRPASFDGGETVLVYTASGGSCIVQQALNGAGVSFAVRRSLDTGSSWSTWNIVDLPENNTITNAMLSDMAQNTIKLRNSAGSGDPEDVKISALTLESSPASGDFLLGETAEGNLVKINIGNLPSGGGEVNTASNLGSGVGVFNAKAGVDLQFRSLTSSDSSIGRTNNTTEVDLTVPSASVTNAKLANMVQSTIKGRDAAAGTGAPVDLTATQVRTIINVADGANAYVHPNHSGDVTSAGDGAQTIAANAVSNTKLADMPAYTIKLNNSTSSTDPGDVKVSALTEETAPTTGDWVLVEESGGALRKVNLSHLIKPTLQKTMTIPAPQTTDDFVIMRPDVAITIQEVVAVVCGGTSPSCNVAVYKHADRSNAGTTVVTSVAVTNVTTGQALTVITAGSANVVAANEWVWIETPAIASAPGSVTIDIRYTEN